MAFSSKEMILLQAKEDLKILETHHPNRFEYLKLELKSFISFIESQPPHNSFDSFIAFPTSSADDHLVSTQASTCEKSLKVTCRGSSKIQGMDEESRLEEELVKLKKKKNRVDLVLDKAKSCLQKIQELKASLC